MSSVAFLDKNIKEGASKYYLSEHQEQKEWS
jgi:hypothetical protein